MDSNKKRIKVLHIDTGLEWRGGQRQVLALHNQLLKMQINSLLVCNIDGVLYQKSLINNNKTKGFLFKGEFSLRSRKLVSLSIKSFNPDIIHCHDSHSMGLIKKNYPNSIVFHTRRVSYPIGLISKRYKYDRASVHVAVAPSIQKYLLKSFKNVYFIPSCIDSERFNSMQRLDIFPKKMINFLFIGAFTKQKGIEILINAFNKLSHQNDQVCLHLVGNGDLMPIIKKKAEELIDPERIFFHGFQDSVENFYYSADYVICPSVDGEGSSGVIKEALAAGKTVIASNLDENIGLIENGKSGFFFENKNSQSLFKIMKKLVTHKLLIKSELLSNQVEKFSCESTARKYLKLYQKHFLD